MTALDTLQLRRTGHRINHEEDTDGLVGVLLLVYTLPCGGAGFR